MEEHGAARLCGHGDEHAQQIGCEAWPGSVGQCHDAAVDERLYLIVAHTRDEQVVALFFHFDAHAAEGIGNDAKVSERHILDADAVAHHRCHSDERAHLNHVGQDAVRRAVQAVNAFNGEQVGGDAADACAHAVEHAAQLLDVRLAGSVVDGGGATGQDGSHNDVGRAGDGGFVEKHISPLQSSRLRGRYLIDATLRHGVEVGTKALEAKEMRVEAPPPYLVAAGLGNDGLTHACQ